MWIVFVDNDFIWYTNLVVSLTLHETVNFVFNLFTIQKVLGENKISFPIIDF